MAEAMSAAAAMIVHLMSSTDPSHRSAAESLFSALPSDDLALALVHSGRPSAAVLLRRLLAGESLSPAALSSLKPLLLAALRRDPAAAAQLCDAAAALEWPELLPLVLRAIADPESPPPIHAAALQILARIADRFSEAETPDGLPALLLASLSHPSSPQVRLAALQASVSIVQCLPSRASQDHFQHLLPAAIRTILDSQEALHLFIELAGTEPSFLRRHLPDVLGAMLQIAEADHLDDGTRRLALEFVVTLAEAREPASTAVLCTRQFTDRFFSALMKMLLEINDDPSWYDAEDDDDEKGTNNYIFAQECLNRLPMALEGNCPVPMYHIIGNLSFDWEISHAALISLTQIAEGCAKVMVKKHLDSLVNIIGTLFIKHTHPRVRWAVLNAIGRLSTNLGPQLQARYHHILIPLVDCAMADSHYPRLQARGASAVVNFIKKCPLDILWTHADVLIFKLLYLLQNEKQMVQDVAWKAVVALIGACKEIFDRYSATLEPYFKRWGRIDRPLNGWIDHIEYMR